MKSKKPNDPRRLTIKSIDKIKETSPGDQLTLTVKVEYTTWCCTEGHEYASATKALTDLFENKADDKERREYVASHLDWLAESILRDQVDKDKAVELLQSVSMYLLELGENDD